MGHFGAGPRLSPECDDGSMPCFVRPLCRGSRRNLLIRVRLFTAGLVFERSRNMRLSLNGALFSLGPDRARMGWREAFAIRRYAGALNLTCRTECLRCSL